MTDLEKILTKIGDRLYNARIDKDDKLISVSMATGISMGTISKIEHGRYKQLRIDKLSKLCDYYGIKLTDILKIEQ